MALRDLILTLFWAVAVIVAVLGWLRVRRVDYRDIRLSEIVADVKEGEELLEDALKEMQLSGFSATRDG